MSHLVSPAEREHGGELLHSGWLFKRGELNRAWRERWCELRDATLWYYKQRADGAKPVAGIRLDQAVVRQAPAERGHEHVLEVVTKQRAYTLAARSHTELLAWVEALAACTTLQSENLLIERAEALVRAAMRQHRLPLFDLNDAAHRSVRDGTPIVVDKKAPNGKNQIDASVVGLDKDAIVNDKRKNNKLKLKNKNGNDIHGNNDDDNDDDDDYGNNKNDDGNDDDYDHDHGKNDDDHGNKDDNDDDDDDDGNDSKINKNIDGLNQKMNPKDSKNDAKKSSKKTRKENIGDDADDVVVAVDDDNDDDDDDDDDASEEEREEEDAAAQVVRAMAAIDSGVRSRSGANAANSAAPSYETKRTWAIEAIRAGSFKVGRDLLFELYSENQRDSIVLYHLACAESLLRNKETSFRYLELALKNGFINYDALLANPDLHNVRTLPQFAPMIKQFKSALHVFDLMRQGVSVRDRKWRSRTFPDTFVGREAVDWLVNNSLADNRESAVSLGRELLMRGLVRHVTDDHDFEDDMLFYQFTSPDSANSSTASALRRRRASTTGSASEGTPPEVDGHITLKLI